MTQRFAIWDEFKGIPDLVGTLNPSTLGNKDFDSRLGRAQNGYCPSCHKLVGIFAAGVKSTLLCNDCEKYGSLPLPETPTIAVFCSTCNLNPIGVPREEFPTFQTGDRIYICDPCERKLDAGLPPGMVGALTPTQEKQLGIRR